MKTGNVHISDAVIPRDDGAIGRALIELESKLAEWTAAVATVQERFAGRAAPVGKASSGTVTPDPPTAVERNGSECDRRCEGEIPICPDPVDVPNEAESSERRIEQGECASEAGAPADESTEDVEALLCLLEPEMAKAIRVQHRLFAGRKSVQELIDDYKPAPHDGKKSWW